MSDFWTMLAICLPYVECTNVEIASDSEECAACWKKYCEEKARAEDVDD